MSKSANFIILITFIASSIFVFFPSLLTHLASIFGVGRGVDFAFYITIPLIAIISIRTGLSSRKNRDKIAQLVRAEALEKFKETYATELDK